MILQDLEKGLSKDIPGVSEGLLPGLSKVAEDEREGAVLPKQSDINIKEEPATNQVGLSSFLAGELWMASAASLFLAPPLHSPKTMG